jgi:hypothetical protein
VIDRLRQRNPLEAAAFIDAKIKEGPYALVRDELEPVRRTAEAAAAAHRQCVRYLEQAGDRDMTLELVGGRVVTGRVATVGRDNVILYEKMDAEGLATSRRDIPLRDISIAFRMRELNLKPGEDPNLAMALYFEAEAQGEAGTRERMRAWARDHVLLAFIEKGAAPR